MAYCERLLPIYIKEYILDLMTAWFVILWRFAATYVRAKHIRAEMLNSNNIADPASAVLKTLSTECPIMPLLICSCGTET